MRDNNFLWLCVGKTFFSLCSNTLLFSLLISLYGTGYSAQEFSSLYFFKFLPLIYFGFIVGPYIDKYNKKNILVGCGIVAMLAYFLFTVMLNYFLEFASSMAYTIVFVIGLCECLLTLTLTTLISCCARKEQFNCYYGTYIVIDSLPLILSPIIAGMLLNVSNIFSVLGLCLALSFLYLMAIVNINNTTTKVSNEKVNFFSGFSFLMLDKPLLNFLLFFSINNILNGLAIGMVMMFIFLRSEGDIFYASFFYSFSISGALLGGLLASRIAIKRHKIKTIIICLFFCALIGRIGLPFVGSLFALSGLLVIRNLLITFTSTISDSIWQERVHKKNQGKVFGARKLIAQGLYPFSVLLGGVLVQYTEELFSALHFGSETMALSSLIIGLGVGEIMLLTVYFAIFKLET